MCDVTEDSSEDFRIPDSTLSIDEATDDFRSSIPVTSSSIFVVMTSLPPMFSTVVTEVAGIRPWSSISAASSSCSAAAGGGGEGVGGGSDAGGGGGGDGESPGGGGGGEGDDDDDKAAPEEATTVEEAILVFFCWLTMTTEVDEVSDLVMILLDDDDFSVVFSSTLFFCLWWMTCSVRTVPELSPAAASCGWLTAMVTAAVAALATCGLSGEDSVLVTGCFCPRPPGGVVVVVALAVPAAPGNGAVGLPRCGCLLF